MRIGIIGATGYTGHELIRILSGHPAAEIVYCTSTSYAGQKVSDIIPSLGLELQLQKYSSKWAKDCDFIFLALPHSKSMPVVKELFGKTKIIDLSSDFRLRDAQAYEKWYSLKHQAPELLKKAVYGLPELFKPEIKEAMLVANPGCYATASILSLLPLAKNKLAKNIIIDAKSGISGAGRMPSDKNLFCSINENFMPYSVGKHKHQPEIESTLGLLDENIGSIVFTPHLVPVDRGILCSIYVFLTKDAAKSEIVKIYKDFYTDSPFVKILKEGTIADMKSVRGSNCCNISIHLTEPGLVKIFASIDNLVKGAAGQAVQNMNIMAGLEETTGLPVAGFMP